MRPANELGRRFMVSIPILALMGATATCLNINNPSPPSRTRPPAFGGPSVRPRPTAQGRARPSADATGALGVDANGAMSADTSIQPPAASATAVGPPGERWWLRAKTPEHESETALATSDVLLQPPTSTAECRKKRVPTEIAASGFIDREACKRDGRCTYDKITGKCEVRSDSDCQQSEKCRAYAECSYNGKGSCVLQSAADCRRSDLCKIEGRCTKKNDDCQPAKDSDCLGSARCKDEGFCRFEKYRHVNSVLSGNICVVARDADCRRSKACKDDKRCVVTYDDDAAGGRACGTKLDCDDLCKTEGLCNGLDAKCLLGSREDCQKSRHCFLFGYCTPVPAKGQCLLTSSADCQRTDGCANKGKCTLDQKAKECVLRSSADCRRTLGCKSYGRCTYYKHTDSCIVASDTDCKQSELCKKDGRCKAVKGRCR